MFCALLTSCFSATAENNPAAAAFKVDVSAVEQMKPALPVIPDRTFTLTDFGAVGDGKTMNTEAFKSAIAAVEKAGGGKLVVPGGVFRTGPFALCSSLDLHLNSGAVIQAPDTFAALGLPDPATYKTQTEADEGFPKIEALITGANLHDVALTGEGTIDGSGQHWWDWSERAQRGTPGRVFITRPVLIAFNSVERLRVADVSLVNSSRFHLVPKNVNDVTIERIKIRAPAKAPNTDGIDIGPGTNFWVHDCEIDNGDDDIVIKKGGSNILIENNTIRHGHGISIGSQTYDGIHDMLVRHCTFDGTVNGIRLKSFSGGGGLMENIRYTDIQMNNVTNAIVMELDYDKKEKPKFKADAATKIPVIRNIQLDHLTINGSRKAGVIHGLPDSRITNIIFRDSTVSAEKDFDLSDADAPICERVTRHIAKAKPPQ